ncbi:extracellular solute-binding protein [Conexibacter stalactiti]|uniref:Extracellular solute-binding protein n=1 Tax=Conexibacter stalactiti TaxID=1940611 RepID=A0ABU4HVZ4_9ACTN|nr:extracellular solute-binding protein [Conexibacter stalactiti]MDW5596239.1 extracellular solute-binding protein [Conexibacter stalactiti]MEC5036881.1 extracellular solute-binding protein [Conexibacter stalactiti]
MSARPLHVAGRRFDPFARALRRQVAAFEDGAAAPPLLEDQWLPLGELRALLLDDGALRDGRLDLALVPTDWLPELIADGHVAPLADALPDDWERAWTPSLRGLQTDADGEVYGAAYHDGPTMLLYRRDLLERAGIEPPRDWEGFLAAARWLSEPAAGRYGTVLAGASDGHNDVYDFVAQLAARGGELLDADGRPAFAGDAGREALRFLHDLWHVHGVVDPAARGWDSVASGARFAAGDGALMVNWAGFAALAQAPGSPTRDLVACAPPPGRALNVYWVLVVGAGSRDLPLARAVARHVASARMDLITAEEGATATRRDSWADPSVQALAPYYAVLEEAHRGAVTMPRTPRLPALTTVLSEMAEAAIWHGEDLSTGLTTAARRAAELLDASPTAHQGAPSR